MTKGKLFLIPTVLVQGRGRTSFPEYNVEVLRQLNHFICEHAKSLRALLKEVGIPSPYDHLTIYELNKHTHIEEIQGFLSPLDEGHNMGVVSDAGCPGVADPGADVVAIAHQKSVQVIPLVGPSSILLALMASGLNGQQFTFHGYLPVKPPELKNKLLGLQKRITSGGESQIFIETPYRNQKTLEAILKFMNPEIKLCIAKSITGPDEFIRTMSVAKWKKARVDLNKEPAVFIMGR